MYTDGVFMNTDDNILKKWRVRCGLSVSEVDKKMSWSSGRTSHYEEKGVLRVPCCDLYRLINIYDVPTNEFYDFLDAQIHIWLQKN